MRILILATEHHYGSSLVVNDLFKNKNVQIVGIVESTAKVGKHGYLMSFWKTVKKSGFAYVSSKIVQWSIHKIGLKYGKYFKRKKKRKLFSYKELTEDHHIGFLRTADINSQEGIAFVKKMQPDLIVSVLFNQILKKEIMKIPKKGCINLHAGPLPQYRGLDINFWIMFNREKYGGSTVHRIDNGIDSGKILALKRFRISKRDNPFSLMLKAAHQGPELINKAIENIKKGKKGWHNDRRKSRYFTSPQKHEVAALRKRKKLFSLRSALNLF